MSKRTDLREIQRLTEDAAIDARKLLIQADNLPPDTTNVSVSHVGGWNRQWGSRVLMRI